VTVPAAIPTAAQRLTEELTAFTEEADRFLAASTIRYRPQDDDGVFILGWHDYSWGPLDDSQRQFQRQLLEAWPPLLERLRLLLAADPSATHKRLDELDEFVTSWLDRPGSFDWTIPATIPEAKQRFHAELGCCFELLGSLGQDSGATIVVPDTNVLVRSPDLARYAEVLGTTSYSVVLVAPVLAELDMLKTGRSNPAVRERARKVSERIKEWRRRGPLHRGVKVQGQVLVRAEAREPGFQTTLSWLDATVTDDRIIAAALELQRRHPTDRVVLLTGDVNLLAKADVAGLPTTDTPDPDPAE
jgi:PIN domain